MDRLSAILNSFRPLSTDVRLLSVGTTPCTLALHNSTSAHLCLLQNGILQWQSPNQAELTLEEGDLIWITDSREGFFVADDAAATLVVCELQLGATQQNPLLERLPSWVHITADQHDAAQTLTPVISLMLQEASQAECGKIHVQNRLAEVLMIRVLRFLMRHALLHEGLIGALADLRLARAITAMHEQPGENWTVASLARRAGMSRTAFSNSFREVIGRPPMRYLTDWRMNLARQWLADQQQSVAEIGERLGYQSETAFRRAFRNITGTTPSAHRSKG